MAKKYKIQVIKLLMKDGKMHDHGSIHEAGAFNRGVDDLIREKFIEEATKSDIEAAKNKDKEVLNVEAEEVDNTLELPKEGEEKEIKEDLLDPLKVKSPLAAKETK